MAENNNSLLAGIISIHAPPRGATARQMGTFTTTSAFQFTPLREGRRCRRTGDRGGRHFNSRPSARGDPRPGKASGMHLISIHAPPRGATHAQPCMEGLFLFQFTPLREGRPSISVEIAWSRLFQFTPLREGRHKEAFDSLIDKYISIHAPPRGATMLVEKVKELPDISIHAPPRGATLRVLCSL